MHGLEDGGCCSSGYYCAVVNGISGCCQNGQTCDGTSAKCNDPSYSPCPSNNFCCPANYTCYLDTTNTPRCSSPGGSSNGTASATPISSNSLNSSTPAVTFASTSGNASATLPTRSGTPSTLTIASTSQSSSSNTSVRVTFSPTPPTSSFSGSGRRMGSSRNCIVRAATILLAGMLTW
ncbi:hypothetical protein JAAARDRAFT_324966 [Jaapia argillacea MUCL 33604]|uniref:Uncharacterized protein n=1 Tax=Jaapia argillacea MUCL 33604 TaxID=933084 RepID=A0A067PL72_9AGAM|nr:hypothetical protein JAAARDRAFT_324966 [Jaapia argillacea MUCL 33604]